MRRTTAITRYCACWISRVPSAKNRRMFDTFVEAAPNDPWRQVYRTVGNEPVDSAQIRIIAEMAVRGLALDPSDVLLDLCCGNGALGRVIFSRCGGGLGVDFSERLIAEARAIDMPGRVAFELADVAGYVAAERDPARFTKASCLGSFQLLEPAEAEAVLSTLRARFVGLRLLFLGELPDRDRIGAFYGAAVPPGVENDHEAPIGIWRTREDFDKLARATGWNASFDAMPSQYHGAHYRYNAILTPR